MNNGFEIKEEKICLDSKHIYICLSATYTGREDYPPSYEYYGELLENDSEYVAPFMENIIFHLSKKRDAMLNNVKNNAEAHKLSEIIENIKRKTEERK